MYRKGHMEGWLGEALRACPEELQPRFAISTKAAPDERALVRPTTPPLTSAPPKKPVQAAGRTLPHLKETRSAP